MTDAEDSDIESWTSWQEPAETVLPLVSQDALLPPPLKKQKVEVPTGDPISCTDTECLAWQADTCEVSRDIASRRTREPLLTDSLTINVVKAETVTAQDAPAVVSVPPEVRRDSFLKLKSLEQFRQIYGENRYLTKWHEAGKVYGEYQDLEDAHLQLVHGLPNKVIDPGVPEFLLRMACDKVDGIENDETGAQLGAHLRKCLPGPAYDSLGQLYTFACLGGGTGGAVLFKMRDAPLGQLVALRVWANKQGLQHTMEVSGTVPRGLFLSIYASA